jgi:hypothetical protein
MHDTVRSGGRESLTTREDPGIAFGGERGVAKGAREGSELGARGLREARPERE